MPKILPISEVKTRLPELVADVHAREDQDIITRNGRAAALLVSVREYQGLRATIDVLSDPELMRQIRASEKYFAAGGKGISFEEIFDEEASAPTKQRRRRAR